MARFRGQGGNVRGGKRDGHAIVSEWRCAKWRPQGDGTGAQCRQSRVSTGDPYRAFRDLERTVAAGLEDRVLERNGARVEVTDRQVTQPSLNSEPAAATGAV